MSTETNKYGLQQLTGSDFEIADGQSDIRKWDVKDEVGNKLGKVTELLFDEQKRKVRYLILDTDDNYTKAEARKIAVPIGIAKVHEQDDEVTLPGIKGSQLEALPLYENADMSLDRQYLIRSIIDERFPIPETIPATDDAFFEHSTFNEQGMYRK